MKWWIIIPMLPFVQRRQLRACCKGFLMNITPQPKEIIALFSHLGCITKEGLFPDRFAGVGIFQMELGVDETLYLSVWICEDYYHHRIEEHIHHIATRKDCCYVDLVKQVDEQRAKSMESFFKCYEVDA